MEMLKPIKLAIKELDQFLFIKRVKDIYNNPELGKTKKHYELWIFTWSLVLTHIFVYFFINLFSGYFLFDPDKHFNLARLTVVLAKNVLVLAFSISLISGVIFRILSIENIASYIGLIFLRVVYVFSLSCILLSFGGVIEFNNIFKYGSYIPNFTQSLFLILVVFLWIVLIYRMLIMPIYKVASSKFRIIRMLSVAFILLFSVIINQSLSTLFSVDFFLNTQEVVKSLSSYRCI